MLVRSRPHLGYHQVHLGYGGADEEYLVCVCWKGPDLICSQGQCGFPLGGAADNVNCRYIEGLYSLHLNLVLINACSK